MFSRSSSFICMDEHGSVKRRKLRGQLRFNPRYDHWISSDSDWITNVAMRDVAQDVKVMRSYQPAPSLLPHTEAAALATVSNTRRWAGLGPEPPELAMQLPESVARSQEGRLWEIDGIVEHRNKGRGVVEYLVRYKGYTEVDDEWLNEGALETAPGAIKEYWARIRQRR
jgi:hypothetical protein